MKAKICFVIETDDANTAFMAALERIAIEGVIKETSLVIEDKKVEDLSDWKQKVKVWLHFNNKSISWLSEEIGMAAGSLKNVIYSNLNVTERVKNAIESVMNQKGGEA